MTLLPSDQLAAIREREQKAEKGPWEPINGDRIAIRVRPGHVLFEARSSDSPHTYGTPYLGGMRTDEDIEFIAHARQDIPALLSHIQAQAEQISRLERHKRGQALTIEYLERTRHLCPDCRDKTKENECLRCETQRVETELAGYKALVERLREALQFYADHENNSPGDDGYGWHEEMTVDINGELCFTRVPYSTGCWASDVGQTAKEALTLTHSQALAEKETI